MFQFFSSVWKPLFGSSTTSNATAKSNAKTVNNMAQSESLSPVTKPQTLRSSSSFQSTRFGKRRAEPVNDASDIKESPKKRIPHESYKSPVSSRKSVIHEDSGSSRMTSKLPLWGCDDALQSTTHLPIVVMA
jgi:hypothetical protein